MFFADHVFPCILVATTACQTFEGPLHVTFVRIRVIVASPWPGPKIGARLDMRWGFRHDARADVPLQYTPEQRQMGFRMGEVD